MVTPRKNPKDYLKVGRPTKFRPEYCSKVIEHMSKGFSFESFAGIVGTTESTVWNWANDFPEFLEAKKQAYARSRVFWEQQGIIGLFSDKDGPKLNTGVWAFNMKNRFGWTDRQEVKQETTVVVKPYVIKRIDGSEIELGQKLIDNNVVEAEELVE